MNDHYAPAARRQRRITAVLITLAVAAVPSARPVSGQQQSCGCVAQLDELAQATRANYAGYSDKASTARDSTALARHFGLLRERAAHTLGADCLGLQRAFIGYFRDHHLQVRSTATAGNTGMASRPARVDLDSLGRAGVTGDDPILGLWERTSGRTRLQVVPDDGRSPRARESGHAS